MTEPAVPRGRTDDQLAQLDVPALLRFGLRAGSAHHAALFGDGTVAAAVLADRAGVPARAVGFLAAVVRSGGLRYAAELPEPLPGPGAGLARDWLAAAGAVAADLDDEEQAARWLEAVDAVLRLRQAGR
ncbi:hypothetical protein ACFYNO_10845 [Kitasatospora sp. NPDC006697]|uniref:hypothetical protein n=1 Tax=Kitasatospora sp. NPDC006697 TaxID=3364020 RepID=UPI00369F18AA